MPIPHRPQQNHLLAALPTEVKDRLFPKLELAPLPLGKVLYESGDPLRHVYFPTDSIVSLLYVMEDGDSAEIAVVGNEGLIGVSLFMGGESTPSRAIRAIWSGRTKPQCSMRCRRVASMALPMASS